MPTKARDEAAQLHQIGGKLRCLRRQAGLTHMQVARQLARQLGVSFQQIGKYERGIDTISAIRLRQLTLCSIANSTISLAEQT